MAVTTVSFFRLEGVRGTLWALGQMAMARPALARDPELRFFKLMGSGTGEGFNPWPNFQVFAIMAVWPSLESARARTAENPVFAKYRSMAFESWTVFMAGGSCRGAWDGQSPFMASGDQNVPALSSVPTVDGQQMIAVLTRATVKARYAHKFWREVPKINIDIRAQTHMLYKIGLGEVPLIHQCTFSIWDDVSAMEAFAYEGFHSDAIARVRAGGWFKEELFARFHVVAAEGAWEGQFPLPIALENVTRSQPDFGADVAPAPA